jgi:NAD(P)-dependent dehydrogenase (short-subunit alcohol dehydrogenase family)
MKLPFQINLNGKTAVVTGAGGVLCSSFAEALAECGANVAVLDLRLEAAEAVASKIRANGGKANAYACNVLDKASLEEARSKINAELGECSILINGAGGNNPKGTTTKEYYEEGDMLDKDIVSFFDLDPDGIKFVFELNFVGTLIPTQVFASEMGEGGVILNVSSMNAFCPLTKIPAYSGAKAAISNFTQWLAVHFSKVGIRVNAIAPGFFITAQNYNLLIQNGEYTDRSKKILSQTPMDRFGKPEELIGGLLYLVSNEASSFVNGVILPIDGGFAAYSGV